MRMLVRECLYLLIGLTFGAVFVPGFLWAVQELTVVNLTGIANGSVTGFYQDLYNNDLDKTNTWLWFLTPYLLFLIVRPLIKNNEEDPEGGTQLSLAAYEGNMGTIKSLLVEGADINAEDEKGHTPLHLAALKGDVDVVRLLLECGADIDANDLRLGARPLHNSARQGHVAVSELLIRHGADLDARTLHGDVALHLAATEGHSAIVALLLKYRARFDIKDSEGRTALQRAEENGHEDIVEIIRKYLTDEWPYLRLVNG